jgi:hypothetical protein
MEQQKDYCKIKIFKDTQNCITKQYEDLDQKFDFRPTDKISNYRDRIT